MPTTLKGMQPEEAVTAKDDQAETTVPLSPVAPAELHIKLSVTNEMSDGQAQVQHKPEPAAQNSATEASAENDAIPTDANTARIEEESESKAVLEAESNAVTDTELPESSDLTPTDITLSENDDQAIPSDEDTKAQEEQKEQTNLEPDLSSPPRPLHGPLVLVNIMEDLVAQRLDDVMEKFRCCRCKRCRMDVTAMALNRLEPKYVAYDRHQLKDLLNRQDGAQVVTALIHATIAVKAKPRHNL
mgnify:CR=1 FL=1